MKDEEFIQLLLQSFPLTLLLFYFLYPFHFQMWVHSILGKTIMGILIILYTDFNPLYGVFACLVYILLIQCINEPFISKQTLNYNEHIPKSVKKTVQYLKSNPKHSKLTSLNKAYKGISETPKHIPSPMCLISNPVNSSLNINIPNQSRGKVVSTNVKVESGNPVVLNKMVVSEICPSS